MNATRLAFALVGLVLAGCAELLPRGNVETGTGFASYAAAQLAFEKVLPYRTRTRELAALGFDPASASNVRLIPYPDLVARLAPNASVALADADPGIRECILARSECQAYEFRIAHETRERRGGFWSDFLNFDRTTQVSGWRFEALVVVRDGLVLFRTAGGEPDNDRIEHQHNPLGPLQSIGESAGRLVR